MLYDPKWEGPSLASFIAWLGTKDPNGTYDFNNCRGKCLLGQYMQVMGIPWGNTPSNPDVGNWANTTYWKLGQKLFGSPSMRWRVLSSRPWTFGAALARAKTFASAHPGLMS